MKPRKRLDRIGKRQTFLDHRHAPRRRGYRSSMVRNLTAWCSQGLRTPKGRRNIALYLLHGAATRPPICTSIHERMTQVGQLGDVAAIVLHPFGRQCVASSCWRSRCFYMIDSFGRADDEPPMPIDHSLPPVLMAFRWAGPGPGTSRHYANFFRPVSPGADSRNGPLHQDRSRYFPWYERKLWGCYDVPGYTRQLLQH